MSNFDAENKTRWQSALDAIFPDGVPQSASWTDLHAINRVLEPLCAKNLNHTMLPRGGGQDMDVVSVGREPGCIELRPSRGVAYVCRPRILYFEHIPAAPWNSFFLLEAAELAPSRVYDDLSYQHEELLELPDGQYHDRSHLDQGILGYDDAGDEIPIPDPHRLVVRYFSGKFLVVAKRSLWNRTSATYDGRHANLSLQEIRRQIEEALH